MGTATKLKKPRRAVRSKTRKPAQRRSRRTATKKTSPTVDIARVEKMLTEYQNALSNYDAQASVALWGTPGMMLNDEMAGVLDDKQKMAEAIAVSYPFYRQLGLDRVEHTINEVVQLSERVIRSIDEVPKLRALAKEKGVPFPES